MKTKASLTAMRLKGMLGLFFQSVNITKHHILIKTADVIVLHVSMDADAVQSIRGWNENWKIPHHL